MPLRYYVQDAVPQLMQAQSDQTFQAISGAGASLGRALEKLGEEHKRIGTQAKAVESFFGAMSEEDRAQLGLTDMTPFKNLSARDKIAFGQGIFQKQAFAQVSAQLREADQRIKAGEAEAQNQQRTPAFLSAVAKYRQPQLETLPAGVEGPANLKPGLDALSAAGRAAEETGFQLPAPALSKLLDEMGQGQDSLFRAEDLGRIRPTEYDGIGFMPTSRGGGQVVTNPNTPQRPGQPLQPRVVVGQNPLTGEPQVTWTGNPEDFEKAFPHLAGPGGKPAKAPAAAPAPMPMPKTKAELKAGQQYQTPRGVATWDGERFTLVK